MSMRKLPSWGKRDGRTITREELLQKMWGNPPDAKSPSQQFVQAVKAETEVQAQIAVQTAVIPETVPWLLPRVDLSGKTFCVWLTTYDRPEQCLDLLKDIVREAKRDKIRLLLRVYADGADLDRYKKVYTYLQRQSGYWIQYEHGGRTKYASMIGLIHENLRATVGNEADYFISLADDLRLCKHFFWRAVTLWEGIQDEKKICLTLLKERGRATGICWTPLETTPNGPVDRVGWVDGAYLAIPAYYETLDWKVPLELAVLRPNQGSGMGKAISQKLVSEGAHLYRAGASLLVHRLGPSKLNGHLGSRHPHMAIDYVDGEDEKNRLSYNDAVTVSLCSIPSRREALRKSIESLLPQVGQINLMLNNYPDVPDFLKRLSKINILRSQDVGDYRSNANMWWSEETNGYEFIAADDVIYPEDYVETMVGWLEFYKRKVVVSAIGSRLLLPFRSYYKSRAHYHWVTEQHQPEWVHVGVAAWHASHFRVPRKAVTSNPINDPRWFNMSDIVIAEQAQKQKVPIVVVPHRAQFLTLAVLDDGIFEHSKKADGSVWDSGSLQTQRCQRIGEWHLWKIGSDGEVVDGGITDVREQPQPQE